MQCRTVSRGEGQKSIGSARCMFQKRKRASVTRHLAPRTAHRDQHLEALTRPIESRACVWRNCSVLGRLPTKPAAAEQPNLASRLLARRPPFHKHTLDRAMTKLILSPTISRRLREIAATNSQHDALQSLRAALADQPLQQAEKMTAQSPAVPAPSAEKQEQAVVLEHTLLISIASWASTQLGADGNGGDDGAFKLSALVRGSRVHVPPKPVFLRVSCIHPCLLFLYR